MKTPFLITIALTLSVILSSHAIAGPMPSELEAKGISAMESGAYEDAEQIFRELIGLRPKSFVGHYNLAAAHSMQGEVEEAIDAMSTALALGFCDKAQMYRDPDLKVLRLDPALTSSRSSCSFQTSASSGRTRTRRSGSSCDRPTAKSRLTRRWMNSA